MSHILTWHFSRISLRFSSIPDILYMWNPSYFLTLAILSFRLEIKIPLIVALHEDAGECVDVSDGERGMWLKESILFPNLNFSFSAHRS
jgi:hypothetical protein